MRDDEAFVRNIHEDPKNDTIRLVYADWLDEHGNSPGADYLRAEVALSKLSLDSPLAEPLRTQLWQAWNAVDSTWLMTFTQPRLLRANPTPFPTMWINFGLGSLRKRQSTYGHYPYELAPELALEEMRGGFQYVVPSTRIPDYSDVERHSQQFEAMQKQAEAMGVRLPLPFLSFMKNRSMHYAFYSPTDCFFTLPDDYTRIRCDPAGECFHVHFFCDSQSCILWDLYVHPNGAHCVIARWPDFFEPAHDLDEPRYNGARAWFVAPSFEAFVYRIWLENKVWGIGDEIPPGITPALRAYIDHYRNVNKRVTAN